MKPFKIGQSAVHLSHGVGKIIGIERRDFNGKVAEFYIMEIQDNGAPKKVFIPVESHAQRLRHIMKKKDVDKIWETLADTKSLPVDHSTWNRRYREYMERIHTGDPHELAQVLRLLYQLMCEKELSFGERKLIDQTFELLVKELALAECEGEHTIAVKIKSILAAVNKQFIPFASAQLRQS